MGLIDLVDYQNVEELKVRAKTLGRRPSLWIWVGPADSGKTTLLESLQLDIQFLNESMLTLTPKSLLVSDHDRLTDRRLTYLEQYFRSTQTNRPDVLLICYNLNEIPLELLAHATVVHFKKWET